MDDRYENILFKVFMTAGVSIVACIAVLAVIVTVLIVRSLILGY